MQHSNGTGMLPGAHVVNDDDDDVDDDDDDDASNASDDNDDDDDDDAAGDAEGREELAKESSLALVGKY